MRSLALKTLALVLLSALAAPRSRRPTSPMPRCAATARQIAAPAEERRRRECAAGRRRHGAALGRLSRRRELAELLLKAGAESGLANRNGSTPLWLAATRGDAAMIEALLEGGADANEPLPLGRRPLMLAARSGQVDAVRALLERGADVNAKETARGTTALMQAADQGHADVLQELIEHGADVAAVSEAGDARRALGGAGQFRGSPPRRAPAGHRDAVRGEESRSGAGEGAARAADGRQPEDDSRCDLCKGIERSGLGFVTVAGAGGNAGAGVGGEVAAFQVDADGNLVLDANGDPVPADTGRGRRPRRVSPTAVS